MTVPVIVIESTPPPPSTADMDDNIDLENVPVKVSTVNFDGLKRTKSDFVAEAISDIFQSKTFGEVCLNKI